jgi:hypothetical protein
MYFIVAKNRILDCNDQQITIIYDFSVLYTTFKNHSWAEEK